MSLPDLPPGEARFSDSEEARLLKRRLHRFLVSAIEDDRADVDEWDLPAVQSYVRDKIHGFVTENRIAVNHGEFADLVQNTIDEIRGLGPIHRLVQDDSVNDILVNGRDLVFVERGGRLEQTDVRFVDDDHVLRILRRIVAPLGRRVDESCPMVDARLPDGSRVNAVIPPIAVDGPCVSIRKFRREPLQAGDLLTYRTLDAATLELLGRAVRERLNVLVSGGTGAGKTSLLNVLAHEISQTERIITVEDTAELSLGHPHVVRLETRPANLDGDGEVTARQLVRNALRMRPDRILVGEVRGTEVIDMLQAMNTGHQGSMATIHANGPREALSRLELLMGFGGFRGSEATLRQNVANAIDFIVQIDRLPGGERRVTSVVELTGIADGKYLSHELVACSPGSDLFVASGVQPVHPRMRRRGNEAQTGEGRRDVGI